jgi:hypothetical protein
MDADTLDPTLHDELYASADAGKTWVHVFTAVNDLPGLAFSPDGKKVFIAGPGDGIKVAPIDDAIAKPSAFTQVFSGQVWGLTTFDGKLYAGNDDFTARGIPRRTVGVSTDEGVTFTTVMDHCELSFPTCPATSTMEVSCREQWIRQGGYVTDFLQTGACVETGGTGGAAGAGGGGVPPVGGAPATVGGAGGAGTAGAAPRSGSSGSSCAVRFRASGSSTPTTWLVAAAVVVRWALRRRRRRRKALEALYEGFTRGSR